MDGRETIFLSIDLIILGGMLYPVVSLGVPKINN